MVIGLGQHHPRRKRRHDDGFHGHLRYDHRLHQFAVQDFKRCVKTLWPYALGMVLGTLGLAKLITFLLGSYPLPTNMAFIGLILGGLPMILKRR